MYIYIHIYIKERNAINGIYEIRDTAGNHLTQKEAIEKEIVRFYKNLQGTAANNLRDIDRASMRRGPQLNTDDVDHLIREVSDDEIRRAVFGINDSKAPGIDGFNAKFFKVTWHIIKADFTAAVKHFFRDGVLFPPINCTTLTLIPKKSNANTMGDYRPIACCNVIHKIISLILT